METTHGSKTGTPTFGIESSFVLAQTPATPSPTHTGEYSPSFGAMFANGPQGGLALNGAGAVPYGSQTMFAGTPGGFAVNNLGYTGPANSAVNAAYSPARENNLNLQEILNTVARLEDKLQASINTAMQKATEGFATAASAPNTIERLNPKDYPDSVHWTKKDWKMHAALTKGDTNLNCGGLTGSARIFRFLHKEDGSQVTDADVEVIAHEARHCFANLDHTLGVNAPRRWKADATRATREVVYKELKTIFPYFCLCDDPKDWKSEQVVTILYARWRHNHKHPADLLKMSTAADAPDSRCTTVGQAATPAAPSEQPEGGMTVTIDTETASEESGPKRKATESDDVAVARKRSKPIENVVVNNAMDNFFEESMSTSGTGASSDEHPQPITRTNEADNSPASSAEIVQPEHDGDGDSPVNPPTPICEPTTTSSSSNEAPTTVTQDAAASTKKPRGRASPIYRPTQAVSGKNFYGTEWVKTNEGASKATFEAAWKALSAAEKEPYMKAAKAQGTRGKKNSTATN